jgi:hypothetical protein
VGKKYKGKKCAYCRIAWATTADHVFARGFFLNADRMNLPKAPACSVCNSRKSKLEHYVQTVLPFGGRHTAAKENLETMVPRRLQRNNALLQSMRAGSGQVWTEEQSALIIPTMTVPIDGKPLRELCEFIAKGLIDYHWGSCLEHGDFVHAAILKFEADKQFKHQFFEECSGRRIQRRLGNGTVDYEGIQSQLDPRITAWRIQFYGGVVLGNGNPADGYSSTFAVATGPAEQSPN